MSQEMVWYLKKFNLFKGMGDSEIDKVAAMIKADVLLLRKTGLSDEEILLVNQVAAYFNYVNRSVLGLGVESSPEETQGYHY